MSYEEQLAAERETLSKVRRHIERQIDAGEEGMKLTDDFTELALNAIRRKELDQLNKSKTRPFFAKVDFRERDQPDREQAYIGRFGLFDRATMEPIVLDWRSPMASLYYEHAFRDVPVDVKLGRRLTFDVLTKRQFEMEKDELVRIYDMSESTGANRLLLERLEQRGEQKLRDIVETIQAEQNAVLRADAGQALVVQGAAGSGKTTIALHRLAFLAYSYRDRGAFDNFLIVAPNKLFIDYISDVLPDLGIEGVVQTTWEEALTRHIPLPRGYRFEDAAAKTALFLEPLVPAGPGEASAGSGGKPGGAGGERRAALATVRLASRLRGSMAMKALLDRYVDRRIEATVPDVDLVLSKAHRLSAEEVKRKFHVDFRHYPYVQRRRRLLQALTQWKDDCVKEAARTLESRVRAGRYAETERRIAEIRELYDRKLAEYAERIKTVELVSFYRNLMSKPANIAKLLEASGLAGEEGADAERLAAYFEERKAAKKQELEWDDIAPLFYLANRFYGLGKTKAFSHIIVDEAQDFSPFQLHALTALSASGSMTILGDLAQSIYPYRGLDDWNALAKGVFQSRMSIERLKKSYRSTVEIMTVANAVLSHANNPHIAPAEPVLRHGEAPVAERLEGERAALVRIARRVAELREGGLANVAIIEKSLARCRDVYKKLAKLGLTDAHLIEGKAEKYAGGVSVVPVYLAKGMEFDAVLLVNPSEAAYDPAAPEDAKLLYVACTRALHRLEAYGWEALTPMLSGAM
ncbi:HelD family protein [Paenibacillus sp.]|uniref:HelD family protein n=1 Tax=Paenibacillus sp. TaxID=58172 RepID=UPI002D6B329F|nr:UvrD-helicase domain-containing protein [Paenibacillus sp.]HZG58196.1 UvrD-helicase domain-containing protein [Paenibacillus sp.]